MNTSIPIGIRAFQVTCQDERTGEVSKDTIVLTKEQLRAAQTVGQSSKELIYRIFNRQGFRVLEIGKAAKREITVDLYTHGDEIVIEGGARLDVPAGGGPC